ncbi:alpha/beta hydrolase family esterase [Luteimonas aquatica]|uniref:alpha/beta hydrolase family esterase n=1 Tax=Luteimonas aquatica TaxID=450364 RepID=UPI001F57B34C|nr:alpha/beta hydrolase-fold protein [Luteimonas aquatica]
MRIPIPGLKMLTLLLLSCTACGALGAPPSGQISRTFSSDAGDKRSYYVALPSNYTASKSYRLVLVFAGTDTTGKEMREWFGKGWLPPTVTGLESHMSDTIFVYPDQKWSWYGDKGWALGPYAGDYGGNHDIVFVKELLAVLQSTYSIDKNRVFATGHSWGGDMAAVVGCFLGDKFKAIAPVAANTPYWFGAPPNPALCVGKPAVWTFFGLDDDYFGDSSPDGLFGEAQNDFWMQRLSCTGAHTTSGETRRYTTGCAADLRLTLYAGGQYSGGGGYLGHQPPDYFLTSASNWFSSF